MNGYCYCDDLLHTTNPYLQGSKQLQHLLNTVTRVEPVKELGHIEAEHCGITIYT